MTDKIFLRLDERFALGADDLQWILYRCGRPVSFVRSTKAILLRCIREKGGGLEAQKALDSYPDTFDAWKAAVRRSKTLLEPLEPAASDCEAAE